MHNSNPKYRIGLYV